MRCVDCGSQTYISYGKYGGIALCSKCYQERYHKELEKTAAQIKNASDMASWKKADISELFWMHLGRYVRAPNLHSLEMILMTCSVICHTDHGLANSFSNALKWAKIDLYTEQRKWNNEHKDEAK